MRSPRTALFVVAISLFLALLAAEAWWHFLRVPPVPPPSVDAEPPVARRAPDPRLAYAGPFRNVAPDVKYVGDAACKDCHLDVTLVYRQHPMGHTLAPIAAVAPTQRYGAEQHNPFQALGARFEVRREGERVVHRRTRLGPDGKPVYELDTDAHYAVGSGSQGYSYFYSRDGYLFQTPISWYTRKGIWDISPGGELMPLVGRPVVGACLFCHASGARHRPGTHNRFEAPLFEGYGIGCERCHGPGERHVAARSAAASAAGAFDDTIVNPKHLPHALREAVCQQCHLEGESRVVRRGLGLNDFRPGLPFEAFQTVFVHAEEEGVTRAAVNHVEQMYQSGCFRGGSGDARLGCTSCHDPHRTPPPERREARYRERCLSCHQKQGCSLPLPERRAKNDSCVACHMPRYASEDVAHTASTDHRVPRRPGAKGAGQVHAAKPFWPGVPVVPFRRDGLDPRGPEISRDLGVGLVALASGGAVDPRLQFDRAVALLEVALSEDPADVEAWMAKGQALRMMGRRASALAAFEGALLRTPEHEDALAGAAALCEGFGQKDVALDYYRRAAAVNPYDASYQASQASLLAGRQAWADARERAEAWVRLDPESVQGRQLLVLCLLKAGAKERAREEFARVEALRPPDLDKLRKWFEDQSR